MPRCTRCNAPLHGGSDAPSGDPATPPSDDTTTIAGPSAPPSGNPFGGEATIQDAPGAPSGGGVPSYESTVRDPLGRLGKAPSSFGGPSGDDTETRTDTGDERTITSSGPGGGVLGAPGAGRHSASGTSGAGSPPADGPGNTLSAGTSDDAPTWDVPGAHGMPGQPGTPGNTNPFGGPTLAGRAYNEGGGAGTGAGPLPPPWANQQQDPVGAPWVPVPDAPTSQFPPSGETSTSLSPEPWAEPAMWQPPAPPKKSKQPYILIAAGMLLLAGIALGIVLWPSGSKSAPPASAAGSQSSESVTTESETASGSPSASSGDLDEQAGAVDGLLQEMSGTRSDLGSVVTAGCGTAGLQRIRDQRQEQLGKARALEVGALDDGEALKDALVRALQASVESNQRYLDVAPGCPSDEEVADVNQEARDAKVEFIRYWSPIAEKAGLPARSADNI
ncbi:hypothetical protein [Actinomadura fibrosa]|uniref:Uncharacterized protein n=1 Tax=Actinomadura fibrosa TaxID=111802 RepID=A0ABW2XZ38_9ACTN|nr:hypothetical protein [Actinomadura fibrosa]